MGNICGGERAGETLTAGQIMSYVSDYCDEDCKEWNRFLTKVTKLTLTQIQQGRIDKLSKKDASALTAEEKSELERLNALSAVAVEALKGDKEQRERYKNNAWITRDAMVSLLEELTADRAAHNKTFDSAKNNAYDTTIAAAKALEEGKSGDDLESLKSAVSKAISLEDEANKSWETSHEREISSNAEYVERLLTWLSGQDGKDHWVSIGGQDSNSPEAVYDYHHFVLISAKDGTEYKAYKEMRNEGVKSFLDHRLRVDAVFTSFADEDGQVTH